MSSSTRPYLRPVFAACLGAALLASAGCTRIVDITLPSPDAGAPIEDGGVPDIVEVDGGFDVVLPPPKGVLSVEVGVPDETGIYYAEMEPGGEIPFAGVGQTGLTARVGLRVTTPSGAPLEKAIVRVDMVRVDDDSVRPAENRLRDSATELRCDDDGVCIYVPMHLQITHLNSRARLEGTVVWVRAYFEDAEDPDVSGTAYGWGVLRRLN